MDSMKLGKWLVLGSLAVSAGLVACSDDTGAGAHAMGGLGGAQPGTGGNGGAQPGTGGSGGAGPGTGGAVAVCKEGLQVLAVERATQARVESAAEHTAVVALMQREGEPNSRDVVVYRDLAALEPGGQPQSRRFTAEELGLSSLERLSAASVFQNELFVAAPEGVAVFPVDGSAEATVLESPLGNNFNLAVGDGFLAVSSLTDFAIAVRVGDAWQWTKALALPEVGGRVVGALGDEVLVSAEEQRVANEDGTKRFVSAELLRVSLDGEILARYPTRGNAVAAMERDGGLLVSEVNSYWGSLKAALEWLGSEASELRRLSDVPVISATDGDDGAFGTALIESGAAGEVLYVANGESGLRRGSWTTDAITLEAVKGPWDGESGRSWGITSVASADGVLVVPGADAKLYFLKPCTEQ